MGSEMFRWQRLVVDIRDVMIEIIITRERQYRRCVCVESTQETWSRRILQSTSSKLTVWHYTKSQGLRAPSSSPSVVFMFFFISQKSFYTGRSMGAWPIVEGGDYGSDTF